MNLYFSFYLSKIQKLDESHLTALGIWSPSDEHLAEIVPAGGFQYQMIHLALDAQLWLKSFLRADKTLESLLDVINLLLSRADAQVAFLLEQ